MNKLDTDYQNLLKDILENGIKKDTRNGKTLSVFGRQIRHKMSDGFPLLTTKKMHFKSITTELLWFLRGDTHIKYLLDNDCNIWTGDAYKNYCNYTSSNSSEWNKWMRDNGDGSVSMFTQEEFITNIKTNDKFAKKWGELGPIYGRQWRNWGGKKEFGQGEWNVINGIDQISNLINELKTNPDSRRLMVNAWHVGELDQMVLPPCHYGFQVYTRELSAKERWDWYKKNGGQDGTIKFIALMVYENEEDNSHIHSWLNVWAPNVPARAISLMWNQRSCDTFLGLPFNIASYGLLLEIIAKVVNMVPDELIGNLGDTHLYLNHIEQAKEQIERKPFELPALKLGDRFLINVDKYNGEYKSKYGQDFGYLNNIDNLISNLEVSDFSIEDYQSHPTIKAPLSN